MEDWIRSGHLVEIILALTLVEGIALAAYHRATGRGVAPRALIPNLLSGMVLLATIRAAILGDWWGWIVLGLTAALVAHLADLRQRWMR